MAEDVCGAILLVTQRVAAVWLRGMEGRGSEAYRWCIFS